MAFNTTRNEFSTNSRKPKKYGIDESPDSQGPFGVQFRSDAPEERPTTQKGQGILNLKQADEYKRAIFNPAAVEQRKFRAQAVAAKDMFKKYRQKGPKLTPFGEETGATDVETPSTTKDFRRYNG